MSAERVDPDEDFTMEWWWTPDGKIGDFRVTRGAARYRQPWYRRLLMRLFGRSNWTIHRFKR